MREDIYLRGYVQNISREYCFGLQNVIIDNKMEYIRDN